MKFIKKIFEFEENYNDFIEIQRMDYQTLKNQFKFIDFTKGEIQNIQSKMSGYEYIVKGPVLQIHKVKRPITIKSSIGPSIFFIEKLEEQNNTIPLTYFVCFYKEKVFKCEEIYGLIECMHYIEENLIVNN
jgi:hypothetical protein